MEVYMRKFEIKDSNIMQVAVQQEILRSDESRHDHLFAAFCWCVLVLVAMKWPIFLNTDLVPSNIGCAILNKAF